MGNRVQKVQVKEEERVVRWREQCGAIGQEIADALPGCSLDVCGVICAYAVGGPPAKHAPQTLHLVRMSWCRIHSIACNERSVWLTYNEGNLARLAWNESESFLEWSNSAEFDVYGVACNGKRLFATAKDGWVSCDVHDLGKLWHRHLALLPSAPLMPIAASGDRVVMCDVQAASVRVYDADGDMCLSALPQQQKMIPISAALTSRNELVIMNMGCRLVVWDAKGRFMRQSDVCGTCVVVDCRDNVYVVDGTQVTVLDLSLQKITDFQVSATRPSTARLRYVDAQRMCVDDSNRMYVVSENGVNVLAFAM